MARCAATGREESGLLRGRYMYTRKMGGSGRRVGDEQDVWAARSIVAPPKRAQSREHERALDRRLRIASRESSARTFEFEGDRVDGSCSPRSRSSITDKRAHLGPRRPEDRAARSPPGPARGDAVAAYHDRLFMSHQKVEEGLMSNQSVTSSCSAIGSGKVITANQSI